MPELLSPTAAAVDRQIMASAEPRPREPTSLEVPTYKHFVRHAERFGVAEVTETAAEYLAPVELARLKAQLARIGQGQTHGRFGKVPKTAALDDVDVAALHAEACTPDEIAELAGMSRSAVYRVLERLTRLGERVFSQVWPPKWDDQEA